MSINGRNATRTFATSLMTLAEDLRVPAPIVHDVQTVTYGFDSAQTRATKCTTISDRSRSATVCRRITRIQSKSAWREAIVGIEVNHDFACFGGPFSVFPDCVGHRSLGRIGRGDGARSRAKRMVRHRGKPISEYQSRK